MNESEGQIDARGERGWLPITTVYAMKWKYAPPRVIKRTFEFECVVAVPTKLKNAQ